MTAQTWFVTGASAGIGRTVVEQLLAAGHRVAATARKPEVLDDLKKQHPDLLWTAVLDVTDTAGLREVVARAFAELGRIDVVFSNAGRGAVGAAEELSDAAIDEQIALNMTAPIQLFRAVVARLRGQGGGRFLQMSTMGAHISGPGASMYHASKWGVEGFFESVVGEVAPFGIGVTMIEPGVIRTGFGAALSVADPLPVYVDTPVGQVHQAVQALGNLTATAPGDPVKVAAAIIASVDTVPVPRRVALGSDAHTAIRAALTGRLEEVDAGEALARSIDYPAPAGR
ncbi:SDR family oxidoreductase [Streptomyces sp. NPDC004324]